MRTSVHPMDVHPMGLHPVGLHPVGLHPTTMHPMAMRDTVSRHDRVMITAATCHNRIAVVASGNRRTGAGKPCKQSDRNNGGSIQRKTRHDLPLVEMTSGRAVLHGRSQAGVCSEIAAVVQINSRNCVTNGHERL